LIVPVLAVPGKPCLAGLFHAVSAGFADGWSATGVFVVGGDVAEGFVQPDAVVEGTHLLQFVTQGGGVGDGQQVRVLGLDVAEQRLDPALVLNGTISKAA
jgi:hypothetical protein